jgi:integrase
VSSAGAKAWLFMFKSGGKQREMGLGSASAVSLAEARRTAAEARALLADGRDPLEEKRAAEAARKAERAKPSFGAFADALAADIEGGFRKAKHRQQWKTTLGPASCGAIRSKPIDEVNTAGVLAVLQPIWSTRSETASRLRGQIERVLDAAKAKGLRSGENPARWRGHLDALLPWRQKLQRGHHAAMAYKDLPPFLERLRRSGSVSSLALEFSILTAGRSGEVRGATWPRSTSTPRSGPYRRLA